MHGFIPTDTLHIRISGNPIGKQDTDERQKDLSIASRGFIQSVHRLLFCFNGNVVLDAVEDSAKCYSGGDP